MNNDGHYIDDPLIVINAKPDFSGMGLDLNTTESRPKKKRPHPLEVVAARHARFDILGWIIKRLKEAMNHDNRKS